MTDIEKQNRAYLEYARGGDRPKYTWPDAPNVPGRPLGPEEQHELDVEKAISRAVVDCQNSIRRNNGEPTADMKQAFHFLQDQMERGIRYGQDVTRLPGYANFVAHSRVFKNKNGASN